MKPKRPRIPSKNELPNLNRSDNYGDNYQINAASKNAKYLISFEDKLILEFWIDKHYSNRKNFGDENGKRADISEDFIEGLIKKSLSHLLYYSLKSVKFRFLNHPPKKDKNIRLVLKEINSNYTDLNVVVEYHFLELNKYEVTVITAMRNEDFRINDGQYILLFEGDNSFLQIRQNKNDVEIDSY